MTELSTSENGTSGATDGSDRARRAANLDFVWEQSGAAYTMRLNRRRWEDIEADGLGWPVMTVLSAWAVMAWARFGSHAITAPRAITRFVLVGVYGWIGLTILMWLAARLAAARNSTPGVGSASAVSGSPFEELLAIAAMVGQAHQPLAIAGLTIQIISILPTGPLTGIIAIGSVVWMGGQLIGAMAAHQQRPVAAVAPITLLAWAPWLATAGLYLWQRLGHLI